MRSKSALLATFLVFAAFQEAPAADVPEISFSFGDHSSLNVRPCITAEPTPCTSTIRAAVNGCVLPLVEVKAETVITYSGNGRSDSHTFTRQWTGNQCEVEIIEHFDGMFLGGTVTTNVSVKASNGQTGTKQVAQTFVGLSPDNQTVRNVIASSIFSVIAFDRSQFKQFTVDGQPAYREGFGVFSLKEANAEQLWNWRFNTAQGVAELSTKWTEAKVYPAKMRQSGYPRLPDFSDRELKLFALQSLVSELYYVPNEARRQWIPNRQRSDYADRLVRIEKEVIEGQPPQGW